MWKIKVEFADLKVKEIELVHIIADLEQEVAAAEMVKSEIETSKALQGTSYITIETKTLSHGRSGVSEETRPLSHGRYSKALDKPESSKYIVYGLCHC